MKHWMMIVLFCLFAPAALLAQETAPVFNRIPANEKGVEELTRLLSDPGVRIEEKSSAIDRLGVLARQLYNSDFPPEKLYNPMLGALTPRSEMAGQELVGALNKELERGPQSNNITVVTAVVQSLGAPGDRRAFVPLMKIIRSRFPAGVKKEAQRSLESIRWD